jgi:Tfp pilus assembly protein PilN
VSRSRTERRLLDGDFASWCAAHPGAQIDLFAGAQRLHTLLAPADLPLANRDALLGWARLQFSHYFGPAAQAWPMTSWVRGSERGVCALAEPDGLARLQATATEHRVRIRSLRPSWTLAPHDTARCAVLDGDMLTLLERQNGCLVGLQQQLTTPHLLTEMGEMPLHDASALLTRPVPTGGPDFIPRSPPLRLLMWAWAATATAACVLMALQAQALRDEAERLDAQARVLQQLDRPRPMARATPSDAVQRGRAWAVVRQLQIDWATRWPLIERALPPDLQLTALDMDARTLRLEGTAPAADAVTQLVDRLADQADPAEEVVLTRLQTQDSDRMLRFEVIRRSAGAPR